MAIREVIFRGKRTDNGKWVKGYLYITHIGSHEIGSYDEEINIERLTFDVIPETVGQYTGLTDKNGVRIFEGDIVKTHYANAQKSDFIEQVVFHNGKFCAYFSNQLCKQWANLYDGTEHLPQDKSVYMDSVEVIGNIYDNPELLETAAKPAAKNIAQSTLAPATDSFELMEG